MKLDHPDVLTSECSLDEPHDVIRIGTPAVRAGLAASDRIVGVDDQELATDLDAMTLQKAVSAHDPGQPIRLEVLRGGSDRLHVEVTRP